MNFGKGKNHISEFVIKVVKVDSGSLAFTIAPLKSEYEIVIPLDVLKTLARSYGVSETEFEVLSLAIEGKSLDAIAKELHIKPDATRKRLGEVYRKFEITGSGPGKLAKLQAKLQRIFASQSHQISRNEIDLTPDDLGQFETIVQGSVQPAPSRNLPRRDWGEAVNDPRSFYGREAELEELKRWIVDDRCQLVALLGIGGVGKTALSLKLAQEVEQAFEYTIWRSLQNAPPIQDLLADLVHFLSDGQVTNLPEAIPEQISLLLTYLQQHRCLVVLDNFETLLQSGEMTGQYRAGFESYGELLLRVGRGRIGETPSQSCLLLTSREKPMELSMLAETDLPVRSRVLGGMSEADAQKILELRGFSGTEPRLKELIEIYRGNPLALKIVSTTIQELFNGNISDFLQQSTTVFGEIRNLLAKQFERLSNFEITIMYWLAISREWVSLAELRGDIVPTPSSPMLLEALESLGRRSLIEKNRAGFRQQPVVMEYVTEQFIERICEEIRTGDDIPIFNSHVLMEAKAKDYVRNTQIRLILKPILEQLLNKTGSVDQIKYHLTKILTHLQDSPVPRPGYAAGNILNLLVQSQVDLEGYDFSGLTVWQAYLQDVDLHRVNFTHTDLTKSVFAETLSSILAVSYSPVGEILAIGDASGKVRLHNTDGELFICEGHMGWVRSVSFSPDGEVLASTGEDRTIRLWNVGTGQCLKTLTGHTDLVRSVRFGYGRQQLASGSDDCTIKLWDIETGHCTLTLVGHSGRVRSVAFSPDGQWLASASSDRTLRLWNVNTGVCSAILKGHSLKIWAVAFSPDGKKLVSGSADNTVKLWDLATGECLYTMRGHTKAVLATRFSPDGKTIVSGSDDQTVKLWDIQTGSCMNTLEGHTCRVWSISYSADGKTLATGSDDQTVKFWDVSSWACRRTLQGHTRGIRTISFNPDGKTLASGGEDQVIRIWNLEKQQPQQILRGHLSRVRSVAFSPDGQLLASGSDDRTVKLWHLQTGYCYKTLFKSSQNHADWIRSVVFSPDGRFLASGGDDTIISLWDIATGELLRRLPGHEKLGWVWSIAFSPDGRVLASGSSDRTIRLWDVSTGECLQVLRGHMDSVFSVAFSPDGQTLASGSWDHLVKLWQVNTGTCVQTLKGHTSWVRSVAFSPDGQRLASGSNDQTVRFWDLETGRSHILPSGHTERVRSIAFSPDGKVLASGSSDASICLWDVETETCLNVLKIHSPYAGMNITGAKGLTASRRATLIALGAVDHNL
jgi:WD40 repeat protein/DNA-binding CsgD family transcriptional regulator